MAAKRTTKKQQKGSDKDNTAAKSPCRGQGQAIASATIPPTQEVEHVEPKTLDERIARAKKSGKYLIITFYVKNGRVYGDWNTQNFPAGDLSFVKQYVTNTAVPEIKKSVQ